MSEIVVGAGTLGALVAVIAYLAGLLHKALKRADEIWVEADKRQEECVNRSRLLQTRLDEERDKRRAAEDRSAELAQENQLLRAENARLRAAPPPINGRQP